MAIQEEKVPTYHFGLPPTTVFFQLRGKKDIESTAEANRDSGRDEDGGGGGGRLGILRWAKCGRRTAR